MFRYNPAANYQPNGDRYLQMLSGKDLFKQIIVVSARLMILFLRDFRIFLLTIRWVKCVSGDKLWTNWNKTPMRLWQTQLNFAVWCASSACGVSSEQLNYTKHLMIRSVYRFHVH